MEEEKITNNNDDDEFIFVSATNNLGNGIKLEYLGFGHAAVSDSFVDYTESFEYQYSESVGLWSSTSNWLSKITARKAHDKKQKKLEEAYSPAQKFKDLYTKLINVLCEKAKEAEANAIVGLKFQTWSDSNSSICYVFGYCSFAKIINDD